MPFYLLLLILIDIIQPAFSGNGHLGSCRYALHLSNDGPVTLDVPVTLVATLDCADNTTEFLYVFRDDADREVRVVGHGRTTASYVFTDHPGRRTVEATAYISVSKTYFEVATGETSFDVEDYIPGQLNISSVIQDKEGRMFLETGRRTNVTLELLYPKHVLRDSEFSYSWWIGEERFTTDTPFKVHQFHTSGPQWVRASVVGRIPSYDRSTVVRYKWGYFDADIIVKDPFHNINISGNTYLEHGQLLNLDISCNGSGPVEYCWKVLPTVHGTNQTNLSCADPVAVNDCSFPILYYFRDSGDYRLAIYVSNLVTSLQRDVEVHIYDVSLRPQLSTVIIPLACTVLVVVIIACAVVAHMRRHPHLDVETADFDFMRTDECTAVSTETSWEVMRRSLIRLLCHCYANDGENGAAPTANYGTILVGMEKQPAH
ncbi:hypothetical protein JTE90_005295 [Oedothorax gibbosus]|uniref:Uncharacterized protein n=1 Tax=Oedothorax gibbosus TaxID=931172 RepID=A0AAV6U2Y7_9ARAC|nr:hypothetical protein JTE90_005295 [Oedothorax gibbosus]